MFNFKILSDNKFLIIFIQFSFNFLFLKQFRFLFEKTSYSYHIYGWTNGHSYNPEYVNFLRSAINLNGYGILLSKLNTFKKYISLIDRKPIFFVSSFSNRFKLNFV